MSFKPFQMTQLSQPTHTIHSIPCQTTDGSVHYWTILKHAKLIQQHHGGNNLSLPQSACRSFGFFVPFRVQHLYFQKFAFGEHRVMEVVIETTITTRDTVLDEENMYLKTQSTASLLYRKKSHSSERVFYFRSMQRLLTSVSCLGESFLFRYLEA